MTDLPVMTPSSGRSGVAQRLRDATVQAHRSASGGGPLDAIVDGTLSVDGYVAMLDELWHVYSALEAAADAMTHHPVGVALGSPSLARRDSIATDLAHLVGRTATPTPTRATEAYVERLTTRAAVEPIAFVAHHYTRYLGDLSGGQFLGRRIEQQLGLGPDSGTSWFHFPGIPDVAAFKDDYRAALDGLGFSEHEESQLVAEVLVAYELNGAVMKEVGSVLR
ncbi:MAG: biliverdin-producing heme oxygenase [Acidimicrobiales bacterium]